MQSAYAVEQQSDNKKSRAKQVMLADSHDEWLVTGWL